MKKYTEILLAIVLAMSAILFITGCSSDNKTETKVTESITTASNSGKTNPSTTNATSSADSSALSTEEKVKNIIQNNLGISNGTISEFETDTEDGKKVYEVEFVTNENRYEYIIDALTNDILEAKKRKNSSENKSIKNDSKMTKEEKYEEIIQNKLGIDNGTVIDFDTELMDGKKTYEVTFVTNKYTYKYYFDAQTDEITGAQRTLRKNGNTN